MTNFVPVSKEEFYKTVGKLDVTVTPVGNYPFRINFKLRNGILMGYEDCDGQYYRRASDGK